MKTFVLSLLFLCASVPALAQDKQPEPAKAADTAITPKAETKAPAHATFTKEESATLRIKLLRVEKARMEIEAMQKKLSEESDALGALFRETAAKYGIVGDALQGYEVINGDSASDREILLKRKPEPKPEEKKPDAPKK